MRIAIALFSLLLMALVTAGCVNGANRPHRMETSPAQRKALAKSHAIPYIGPKIEY